MRNVFKAIGELAKWIKKDSRPRYAINLPEMYQDPVLAHRKPLLEIPPLNHWIEDFEELDTLKEEDGDEEEQEADDDDDYSEEDDYLEDDNIQDLEGTTEDLASIEIIAIDGRRITARVGDQIRTTALW